jgi:hypothetical protein
MKIYLAICVIVGFLLGAAFVVENERYDQRRHGGNDEWWTWTQGDYERWGELHYNLPPADQNVPEPEDLQE